MRLLSIIAAASAAAVAFTGTVFAQEKWPEKPIEMLCATSAGSGAANWCLLMSELMSEQLGAPVEVLFKPAGAGNEAATYVDERPADGYTWLQRNTSYGGYMNLPTFRPDPANFEVPVEVEKFLYVVAVNAASPYKTWEDLVARRSSRFRSLPTSRDQPIICTLRACLLRQTCRGPLFPTMAPAAPCGIRLAAILTSPLDLPASGRHMWTPVMPVSSC